MTASPVQVLASALILLGANACASGDNARGLEVGTINPSPTSPGAPTATGTPSTTGKPGTPTPTGTPSATTGTPTPTGAVTPSGPDMLGGATQAPTKTLTGRYDKSDVTRNGQNYKFIANGWGPNFVSHSISLSGTAFTIDAFEGKPGTNYEPAGYPSVFCGKYSDTSLSCGLPKALSEITSLRTGWRWSPNGNATDYNAAYDIWVGDGTKLTGYFMVWLRDPRGQQPAGSLQTSGITVANVPGKWNLWTGTVNKLPIVNWVQEELYDLYEIEFDVMDFINDAKQRGLTIPGTHINAVAVGFEIWQGPIANLKSEDFYLDVK